MYNGGSKLFTFHYSLLPIKMKSFLIVLLSIAAVIPSWAQEADDEVDLQALYQQIDEAIEQAPRYVTIRQGKIADAQNALLSEGSMEKRFALAEQLFELYHPYRNDSALYYADLCVAIADSLHRKDMEGLCLSRKARQCSGVGLYVEALNLLEKVDKRALGREGLTKYYEACMHIYGELGTYSQQHDDRWRYYGLQDSYRDSVLAVAEEGSEEYLHLKMDVLTARKLYQDALAVSDSWLGKVADGTHEEAFAAFYRSVVYDKLDNHHQVRYWLGKSALDDIKCAVYDQASLFMLAERLCEDGDYKRAYRYVRFCEECNMTFSSQLRNYQVRYVANVLEASYRDSQARYSKLLFIATTGAILLLGVVALLLFRLFRKRHKE